ncbi:Stp1/IreP family PP2C-type Ser/Thr phosphatase [Alloacidobacterium dinghuense]|uniref:Stp1/IreP family PP2C-type Ser/Thr phosphatase n=1 Tax=Alloacidobacterium dinghuense TaxID=2763107 RepID=A0A7G8BML6_9BACT|nr:Stp1/IreP family PP2C-type Ser/Thr phosphatase [Alloacidobacterium dinghuense]QNI33786.1 Stp1/IreP family PP2C-type Ser/Thr phosphatase [Alloacidobacterium dinghuense]
MESQTGLKLEVAGLTDVGCKRTNNEDSLGYDLASQVFVVCDGMGGMAAGEVASSTAVHKLIQSFGEMATSPVAESLTIEERLYYAIAAANQEVCALARANHDLRGMGTTLVAACLDGRKIVIGNVGDSRAYFLRDGGCVQITLDHSYLAEQIRNGVMTEDDAEASPLQSLITRAIGTTDSVEPDLFSAELEAGDIVLLTTDGLTRYADANAIARLIFGQANLQQACQALIDAAKVQGAVDNVTCVLLHFSEGDSGAYSI